MKVILLKDVSKLGRKGEVKDVPQGHALNFLIPRGFAKKALDSDIKDLEIKQEQKKEKENKEKEKISEMLKRAGDLGEVVIIGRANDKGHLFSQIKKIDLIKVLKEKNIDLPENLIKDFSFKEIGEYKIKLEFENLSRELKLLIKGE